nr:MAG TPA: NUMOD4 motif protein [Caudoviricetes sp.]
MWLPVCGYEGLYEVSDCGEVKSLNYQPSKGDAHYVVTSLWL